MSDKQTQEKPVILYSSKQEKAKPILAKMKKATGAESYVFLTRDGVAVLDDTPEDTHVETAAIMYATMYGGSITAQSELRKKGPENIIVNGEDSSSLVTSVKTKYLLAVVLGKGKTFDSEIRKTISDAVTELSDVILD